MKADETVQLMRVAQGLEPADLVVRGGKVLNVYTGELHPHYMIAAKGERIAYVGPEKDGLVGEKTYIIEAQGRVVIPGLIDGHTHLVGARFSPERALPYIVPGGTTCIITEIIEVASVMGLEGIIASLEALKDQPIKLYACIPPLACLAPFMEDVAPSLEEYRGLLARPDVLGLGELYWGNLVLREDRRLLQLALAARQAGKVVEGHAAGAKGPRLMAYACAGVSSCHEPISVEEVLERLRLGFHTMVREGRVRQELEAVAPLWRDSGGRGLDLRRLILVTDSVGPDGLVEEGYLEVVVRKAVALGLDPVKAIQAVTLNVAEHFGLDQEVGGIAPGRYADLVIIPDLGTIEAELVVSNGRVVAQEGKLLVPPRLHPYPERFYHTVLLPGPLTEEAFLLRVGQAHAARSRLKVRAIEMTAPLVTREAQVELEVRDGVLKLEPQDDVILAALIDRWTQPGEMFLGLLKGFGMREGGFATTMSWDCHHLLVVGVQGRDMALAANRVRELQGGAAVYLQGEKLAELPAPVAGVISQAPLERLAQEEKALDQALRRLGARWPRPSLSLDVLTTAAIPHLRLSHRGYVRVRDGTVVGLWD